jgi:restriction system protein
MKALPKIDEMVEPLLRVLSDGVSLDNEEIRRRFIQALEIPEELKNQIHSGSRTELEYRLAWARTKAKNLNLLESAGRKTWKITELGLARIQSR